GLPARGERAQERGVGAPALWVSGARAPAAANLLGGRDQRAHPLGEFEYARLFAARHVDDLAAAALAPARERRGQFEQGGGGVLARGRVRAVAVDGGARREDDERARAGAAHGVKHVGPGED